MPAKRQTRPAPGVALVLPRVGDEATQQALDRIQVAFRQVQTRLTELERKIGES